MTHLGFEHWKICLCFQKLALYVEQGKDKNQECHLTRY